LARDPKTTESKLHAAMTAQHGRMPDFCVSKRQQNDLVAYVLSLRTK